MWVNLSYACRCPGDQQWLSDSIAGELIKTKGKWEMPSKWWTSIGIGLRRCKPVAIPKDWSEQLKARERAERRDLGYIEWINGKSVVGPFDIEYPDVVYWTATIGPTWMFVPARTHDLEVWFNRKFTDEEVLSFQTDPQKAEELVRMLEVLQQGGRIDSQVVEFYRKALTYEGRVEIWKSVWPNVPVS